MRPNRLVMENVGPFTGRTELCFDTLDDIFLITGKTGSGKTTIFDALCYVLYGTLPGSRESTVHRLRSDFAPPEAECSILLDFSLGEKQYRVERSPKQEKPKKRGSGFTTVEESAVLYEKKDGKFISLSGKKSEADEKIRALIGLSDKEFVKIVLLPQGEFAEFLRQNTKERKEVLQKLFPIDLALRIKDLALSKARDLNSRLVEAERALEKAAEDFPEEHADKSLEAAEKALQEARKKAEAAEKALSAKQEELRLLEEESVEAQRLEQATAAIQSLEAEKIVIDKLQQQIEQAQQARSLLHSYSMVQDRETSLEKIRLQCSEADAELRTAETILAELDKKKEEIEQKEAELASFREKKEPLRQAAQTEEQLAQDEASLQQLQAQIQKTELRLTEQDSLLALKQTELKDQEASASESTDLEKKLEWARESMALVRQLKDVAARLEPLLVQREELEQQRLRIKTDMEAIQKQLPVLTEEVTRLKQSREQDEKARNAAALALDLRRGEPCPVCGSTEHPLPAAAQPREFGIEERITALERSIHTEQLQQRSLEEESKSVQQNNSRITAELELLENTYRQTENQFESLYTEYRDYADYLPDTRLIRTDSKALAEELRKRSEAATECSTAKTAAGRAKDRCAQLYREINDLEKQRSGTSSEIMAMKERYTNREELVTTQKEQVQAILETWRTESVSYALGMLMQKLEEGEQWLLDRKNEKEAALRSEASAKASKAALEKQKQETEAALAQSSRTLDEALALSAFNSIEAVQQAQLETAEEKKLLERIQEWKEQLDRQTGLKTEIERHLNHLRTRRKDKGYDDNRQGILDSLEKLAEKRKQAESERDHAAAAAAALEKDRQAYLNALEHRKKLAQEAGIFKKLSDDLNGANHKKRAFDAWLLALYLEEVAAYAGKRLQRMSEGRYSLVLNTEGEGRNRLTGLDLAVFDAYTGKTRPCATLSGGESFMASISLALGLADSIQARSGAVRLDAVFIDEGFGSLDEASLDKALGILDEIRDHRMVGLISHVSEMKNRIPSRIDVIKSGSGSSIRIYSDQSALL